MPKENSAPRTGRRPQRRGRKSPLYAAVDLGTNNCRLLVARKSNKTFHVVDSFSNVVRLGEGLTATGELSEAAMSRAMIAFREIKTKLKHRKVGNVRCIATQACRQASNGKEFIAQAKDDTGLAFKIISPYEEARLAVIGCHDLYEGNKDLVMVLDIGGGSTEISFVRFSSDESRSLESLTRKTPIIAWRSFPIGVVTLTEQFQHLPPPDRYPAMLTSARTMLKKWAEGVSFSEQMQTSQSYIVGTSGTVTCLAGIHLKLDRYRRDKVDGIWMKTDEVTQTIDHVNRIGRVGRLELPTVGEERADLMMAGCAILEAATAIWRTNGVRVADRGLREGLLLSMMYGPKRRRSRKRKTKSSPEKATTEATEL